MTQIVIAATKEDVEAFNNGQITLNEMRKRAGLSQIGEPTFNKKFISKKSYTGQALKSQGNYFPVETNPKVSNVKKST